MKDASLQPFEKLGHTQISAATTYLADAATKLAVMNFDTLLHDQTPRVESGAIAPRPPFWVMYTANPPTYAPAKPRHRAEIGYPPPSMVDNPGSRPLPKVRFRAPLTTIETESSGCDPPKLAPYLQLQETHFTSKSTRSNHCYH